MKEQVGIEVMEVLEQAGVEFFGPAAPDVLQVFLHHVGATSSFSVYDGRSVYWQRLQILLDSFFTADQRAEICERLLARLDFLGRQESYDFVAEALAERRLKEMRASLIAA